MSEARAYAAQNAAAPLEPFRFMRREPCERDIRVDINAAYDRMMKNDVRYRFTIDLSTS